MAGRKIRNYLLVLAAAVSVFTMVIITAPRSFADNASLANKSKLYGLSQCYESGGFVTPVESQGWQGTNSLIYSYNDYYVFNGTSDQNQESCPQIADSFNVIPAGGSDVSQITTFMRGIGYTASATASDQSCVEYKFTNAAGERSGINFCTKTNAEGKVESNNFNITYSGPDGDMPLAVELKSTSGSGRTYIDIDCNITYWTDGWGNGGCSPVQYVAGETDFVSLGQSIYNQISGAITSNGGSISRDGWSFEGDGVVYPDRAQAQQNYTRNNHSADGVVRTFSGGTYNNVGALKLDDGEKLGLLEQYINGRYIYYTTEDTACSGLMTDAEKSNARNDGFIEAVMDTNGRQCWIKASNFSEVPGYNSDGYFDGTPFNFEKVVEELNALRGGIHDAFADLQAQCTTSATVRLAGARALVISPTISEEQRAAAQRIIDTIEAMNGVYWESTNGTYRCKDIPDLDGNVNNNGPTYTPPSSGGTNIDDEEGSGGGGASISQCLQQMGALGWIICPTSELVGKMIEGVYNKIADQFLNVKAEFMSTDSGTYQGWEYFRNIANIIFAAVLLVVIFSQLTGFGVSNYGIKKILPTLIIVAVLVNISFLVCQFLVDLSNVLGYSLRSIFTNIPMDGDIGKGALSVIIQNLFGAFGIIVGAGALANFVDFDINIWILPLILGAITIALGVLFFYILLGVRQAAVIILVAISPVAIVCYALPNTKSLFDKWKKAFMGLLMLFPICGALMGAGQFASAIIIVTSGGSFFLYLVAALMQVVPFFFVPSLLRSSFSALGNIGARISTMGRTASGRLNRAIRGTEGYQDLNEQLRGRAANRLFHRPERVEARHQKRLNGRLGGIYRGIDSAKASLARTKLGGKVTGLTTDLANSRQRRARERSDQYYRNKVLNEAAREAIEPGTRKYDAMVSGVIDADTRNLAKDYTTDYERSGAALSEAEMLQNYEQAIADLSADDTDMDARARMMSATDILMRSDDGRKYLYGSGLASNADTANVSDGAIQEAGKYLMNTYGKDLKKTDSPLFSLAGKMAHGIRNQDGEVELVRREDGTFDTATASAHDFARLKDHTVADFVNSDDHVHEAVVRASRDWKKAMDTDTAFKNFVTSGAIDKDYMTDLERYKQIQKLTDEGNVAAATQIRDELANKYRSDTNWEQNFQIANKYSTVINARKHAERLVTGALSNDQIQKKGTVEGRLFEIRDNFGYPNTIRVPRNGRRRNR